MRNVVKIIGEGPTEFFYLNSLKDDFPFLQNIAPKFPKHSSIKELEASIKQGIEEGVNRIFVMIDMDNKRSGKEKQAYDKLKMKYHNLHKVVKKKGIDCEVRFFETERCTELFFLYYFKFTTKSFPSSDDVVKDLNGACGYEKTKKFFAKHPLHPYFTKMGGDFFSALKNADKSIANCWKGDNAYSELGKMFHALGIG